MKKKSPIFASLGGGGFFGVLCFITKKTSTIIVLEKPQHQKKVSKLLIIEKFLKS